MAKDEQETKIAAQPMIMVNSEQYGAQRLYEEQEANRKAGIKLDRSEPGGKFLDADGLGYHDANGRTLGKKGEVGAPPANVAVALSQITSEADLKAAEEAIQARRETLEAEKEAADAARKEQDKKDAAVEREREKALAQQEKDQAAAAKKTAGGRR